MNSASHAVVGTGHAKRRGPRQKKLPQRTCVSCRDKTAKRGLIRIVRSPDGSVHIDQTGRLNGRGAYLCENPLCWQRAMKSGSLQHALKVDLEDDDLSRLSEFATQLAPVEQGESRQSQNEVK
jgi:uncharacterized protein